MRDARYPRAVLNVVLHAQFPNTKLDTADTADTADNKKAQPKLDLWLWS